MGFLIANATFIEYYHLFEQRFSLINDFTTQRNHILIYT